MGHIDSSVVVRGCRPFYALRMNFNPVDARGSAGEAWATDHKIGEADFVDSGQVRFIDKSVLIYSDGLLDLEHSPVDVADQNLRDVPVFCRIVPEAFEKESP